MNLIRDSTKLLPIKEAILGFIFCIILSSLYSKLVYYDKKTVVFFIDFWSEYFLTSFGSKVSFIKFWIMGEFYQTLV